MNTEANSSERTMRDHSIAKMVAARAKSRPMSAEDIALLTLDLHAVMPTSDERPQTAACSDADCTHDHVDENTSNGHAHLPAPVSPAVAINDSVTDDKVFCLECGKGFKMLRRHLKESHDLSTADYQERWNLDKGHPLTAPNYSRRKRSRAIEQKLGKYDRTITEG